MKFISAIPRTIILCLSLVLSSLQYQPTAQSATKLDLVKDNQLDDTQVNATKITYLYLDANSNGLADADDQIAYQINVTNTSESAISNVVVEDGLRDAFVSEADVIPETMTTSLGMIQQGFTASPAGVVVNVPQLNVGQTFQFSFRVKVRNYIAPQVSRIINFASVYQDGGLYIGRLLTQTNIVTTPIPTRPELRIGYSLEQPNGVGNPGPTILNIYYQNSGSAVATGVVIGANIPSDAALDSINSALGWVCTGTQCHIPVSNLQPAEIDPSTKVISFAVAPLAMISPLITQTTFTTSISDDGTHGSDAEPTNNIYTNTASFGLRVPLSVTKSAVFAFDANMDGKLSLGDRLTYTISITNSTNKTAYSISVLDPNNGESQVLTTTLSNTHGSINWNPWNPYEVSAQIPQLGPSDVAHLSFVVELKDYPYTSFIKSPIGYTSNQAQISDGFDFYTYTSEAITPILYPKNFEVVQTLSTARGLADVIAGELITFTFTITHIGSESLNQLLFNNDLQTPWVSDGFQLISNTVHASQGIITESSSIGIAFGPINPGQVVTASFNARVNTVNYQNEPAVINTAFVYWHDLPFYYFDELTRYYESSNAVNMPMSFRSDVWISKKAEFSFAEPNSTAKFLISYGQKGFAAARTQIEGVTITEKVPSNTSFDANASAPALWDCPNGSPAGTICTTLIGSLPLTPTHYLPDGADGVITFGVKLNPNIDPNIKRIFNQVRIADNGAAGVETNLTNNVYSSTLWIGSPPVTATQFAQLIDENYDGILNADESVRFTLNVTNSSSLALPGLIIYQYLPSAFGYIYGSGVLTAPDGIISPVPEYDLPPGVFSRITIDVPLPPGESITATFAAKFYPPYIPSTAQTPALTITLYGVRNVIHDEYLTELMQVPASQFTWSTTSVTPTPTQTPVPSTEPTVAPTRTAHPDPGMRLFMPVLRR